MRFILGLFYSRVRLRSDQEPAATSLVDKVCAALQGTAVPERAPRYSSQSNGAAERALRRVVDQVRTLRSDVEARYAARLTPDHVIFPWLVRQSAFLVSRFAVKTNGSTAYRDVFDSGFTQEVVPFGERHLPHPDAEPQDDAGEKAPQSRCGMVARHLGGQDGGFS